MMAATRESKVLMMLALLLLGFDGIYCFYLRTHGIIIRCEFGCTATSGCTLVIEDADERVEKDKMDSGHLITDLKNNYSAKNVKTTQENSNSFFLAASYRRLTNYKVLRGSVTSNNTQETGVNITGFLYSIVYDRDTNAIFWSNLLNVKKGTIGESVSHVHVKVKYIFDMGIYKDQIIYTTRRHIGMVSKLSSNATPHIWYSSKKHQVISKISLDMDMICWVQYHQDIFCANLPSNETQQMLRSKSTIPNIAVISLQYVRIIVFVNGNAINVTIVNTDSHDIICSDEKTFNRKKSYLQSFIISNNILYSTYKRSVKVEAREIFKNCSIREIFSWEYKGKHTKYATIYMTVM